MQSRGAFTSHGLSVIFPVGEQLPHWVFMACRRMGGRVDFQRRVVSMSSMRAAKTVRARARYHVSMAPRIEAGAVSGLRISRRLPHNFTAASAAVAGITFSR